MTTLLKRLTRSGIFSMLVKAGLTILAFWFVFRDIDFSHLHEIYLKQEHALLFEAAVMILFQALLGAFRWRLIVNSLAVAKEQCIHVVTALRIYYISVFFTCCLPGTVGGDVIRVWLTKSEHIPLPLAINSVVIDRILALLALMLMVIFTLPWFGDMAGFNAYLILPGIAVAAVVGLLLLFNIERLLGRFSHYRIVHWILYFAGSLKTILTHPVSSVMSLSLAIIAHSCFCLGSYILARSLAIEVTPLQCLALIPPVMLATTLPISIGGWGIREAATIALFGLIGVSQAAALMLSIQLGLLCIIVSLPASILWLVYRRQSPRSLPMVEGEAMGSGQ